MVGMILRIIAGIFIILMGLYVAEWSRAITSIEKVGQFIWKFIQPLTKPFLPPTSPSRAVALGLLWGWLPCGLVYSTLILASASPTVLGSAFVMLGFGLGTVPTMLLTGMLASQLTNIIRNKNVRYAAAILMILMGAWIIYGNSQHLFGHAGMDHSKMNHGNMNHQEMDHSKMDHSEMNKANENSMEIDHSKMDHSSMGHN